MQVNEQFAETVNFIKTLGFNPNLGLFVQGVSVKSGMTPSTWKTKVALYESLGWSEKEVISAFSKQPFCLLLSQETIRRRMDFFVNKMRWGPSVIAARTWLLCLNLEKRVIPRCSVMNILASKELVRRNFGARFLQITEKDFLDKYVIKYQDQHPEVVQAYTGNLGFVGPDGESTVT